ncbi:MAG: class I adenylate-forming enzyme family protein [Acidimicrobiales bacterium]
MVTQAARRWGDAVAYVAPTGWSPSYAALDRLSDEVAVGLAARGIGEGDVVGLVLPSIPEYVVAYAAAAKLGAVTAGVNARLTSTERVTLLELAEPAVVVATPELAPSRGEVVAIDPASDDGECLRELRAPGGARGDPTPPALAEDPDRPVAIVFTSGTTGLPKGAVYAGRQLDAITRVDTGWRWGGGAPALAATTFAHLGPMTKLPGVLLRGGTTYLLERWRAAEAIALIARHRMPGFGGIPTQVALMLAEPSFADHDLSSVQALVVGGGPATPALIRRARTSFGAAVSIRYSCSEAGVGTGTAPTDPDEDAEVSVGRPQPGVELQVLDPDDRPVSRGEVGAVCLRSAATMTGYWRAPELSAAAFTPDGAVRTGDLGWVDEAGRLRLVGRAKEMYVRGGENVFPMEVEGELAQHPAVAQVVVVPRAHDVWGEVGVAVLVPRDRSAPPTLAALREHAAPRVAPFKLPDEVIVVDELPLTPMEKIDRRALAARLREGWRTDRRSSSVAPPGT